MSSLAPRKVGVSVWGTISSFSRSGEKGEESAVCFASIYLEAPVQCPLVDNTDGFLDPVGCSGGVLRRISDCQVVCM